MEKTPIILGMCPKVKKELEDLLEGKVYCMCGNRADRFTYSQRKKVTIYFCHDHMPDPKTRIKEKPYNQHPLTAKAFLKYADNEIKKVWKKE